MAHAQKPDFVFQHNGRVHLNRWGRQFSRLLAAEVCTSAVVMLDTPCSEVVWRVLATHSTRQFPFTSPILRHDVSSEFNWALKQYTWGNKDTHNIITYYIKDQLQLAATHIGKPTQWEENYCIYILILLYIYCDLRTNCVLMLHLETSIDPAVLRFGWIQ